MLNFERDLTTSRYDRSQREISELFFSWVLTFPVLPKRATETKRMTVFNFVFHFWL